ncbi:MAG TPA: helix-turn-helix domain-containing protein [Cellvibrionaceae bacterium]|nr:helix-turn-helix domain-containing protein [Cellvibrionaceae bacterium]HMW47278.1 helix-turn-helix domain-containing protein [Cellvibrionaceae bacterium]HMW71588.1 helix-turn-helix domain-containing protein [Cellvibrionaceae bacterium]HMY39338.1 helix-turn-helix domain-containing protein [Marinagarivorans sp.]HNG60053.1 helix-turn-helix domain-containing protein [Cellvibrionaceae bacterium]
MKRTDTKSHCPINFTLEILGDPWSLLVLRDMVFFGKQTFKEFLESSERITTSVLTSRLNNLEKHGIVLKQPHPSDQRSALYRLTEKGIGLVPVLLAMMEWGTRHDPASAGHRKKALVNRIRAEQSAISREVQTTLRKGGAVFVAPQE